VVASLLLSLAKHKENKKIDDLYEEFNKTAEVATTNINHSTDTEEI
jgi:hypothetical protein